MCENIQNMVMLHNKLKGIIKCGSMVANILPAYPPDPAVGVKRSKLNFSEHSYVAYQIKGNHQMQQHGIECFAPIPLTDPAVWV